MLASAGYALNCMTALYQTHQEAVRSSKRANQGLPVGLAWPVQSSQHCDCSQHWHPTCFKSPLRMLRRLGVLKLLGGSV